MGSAIGGLFSRETENPNAMFADPNNPFYTTATKNYYKNLSRTLGANTPGKATLLAMQSAGGGSYGGSAYVAGKQNENYLAKNRDVAASSSENFQTNLFTEGMRLVSQGNLAKFQDQNSFSDNLITLGGGLFSRFFDKADFGDIFGSGGGSDMASNASGNYNSYATGNFSNSRKASPSSRG